MSDTIYRAEKQTDPDKAPGQIINRPQMKTLADYIDAVQEREAAAQQSFQPFQPMCCHQTVIERCEGCPYGTINS